MLRYPGGCLVHNYNWKNAVGPLSERGEWQFGIDEYIKLCRDLGAEPIITVTDYALPANEIPQHAAELVEYLNSPATPEHPWAMRRKEGGNPEPYRVKWFELGNESEHGNHNCIPARCFTPEEYIRYAKTTATAMRKVDPTLKIGVQMGAGTSVWPSQLGSDDCALIHEQSLNKEVAPDFFIVHDYSPIVDRLDPESSFKSAMAYGDQLEWKLKQWAKTSKKLLGRRLPVAITE
jgi:alpha-N-arabinofuranosidase